VFTVFFLIISISLFITSRIGYAFPAVGAIIALLHFVGFIGLIFTGIMSIYEIIVLSKSLENRKTAWIYLLVFITGTTLFIFSGMPSI
jgi:hypothetical protein